MLVRRCKRCLSRWGQMMPESMGARDAEVDGNSRCWSSWSVLMGARGAEVGEGKKSWSRWGQEMLE